jgi:hypothetical protein
MNTFETLRALLSHDLHELRQIRQRGWRVLPMTRVVKEEHLGRCCYLAEEFLSSTDLRTLKMEVGLDEQQWRSYKEKVSGQ